MRIRTIKPDFWLHEGLAQLPALHRLLFIGLWQLADREGRLENRPRRIQAAIFPYENVDCATLLADLDAADFVHIYGEHLALPGFKEHQRPHPKEAASALPPPPHREKKRRAVSGSVSIPSTPVGREGKGTDNGKGREVDASSTSERPPPLPAEPADKLADGHAFWAFFQHKRHEAGLVPEKMPRKPLGPWWSEVGMELNGDYTRLEAAAYRFADSKHWQEALPPVPFNAFMAVWRDFVPQARS